MKINLKEMNIYCLPLFYKNSSLSLMKHDTCIHVQQQKQKNIKEICTISSCTHNNFFASHNLLSTVQCRKNERNKNLWIFCIQITTKFSYHEIWMMVACQPFNTETIK